MIANGKENETRAKSNHVMQDTEAAANFAWYLKKNKTFLKFWCIATHMMNMVFDNERFVSN